MQRRQGRAGVGRPVGILGRDPPEREDDVQLMRLSGAQDQLGHGRSLGEQVVEERIGRPPLAPVARCQDHKIKTGKRP
jgi:hypothetical protein